MNKRAKSNDQLTMDIDLEETQQTSTATASPVTEEIISPTLDTTISPESAASSNLQQTPEIQNAETVTPEDPGNSIYRLPLKWVKLLCKIQNCCLLSRVMFVIKNFRLVVKSGKNKIVVI